MFMVSAAAVLVLFFLSGILASGRARSSSDFSVANRKAGIRGVSGVVLGALVGGGATVGTVQMAYQWGISAWWFTLGSGIACLVMALLLAKPIRSSALMTLPQFLEGHYGPKTALLAAVSTASGSFLSMVAQMLSGIALMRSVFPLSAGAAASILCVMVLVFAFGGGIKSFSRLGEWKIVFLYGVMVLCTVRTFSGGAGGAGLFSLPANPFFNMVARGAGKDLGSLASLVCGVVCGQIYIQALYSASDDTTAKRGFLLASGLIPLLGLLCIWIGLGMRASGVLVEPAQAFPHFIMTSFPPILGGVLWSGIMITVLGTAVGVSLGIATNLTRDMLLKTGAASGFDDRQVLLANRVALLAVTLLAGIVAAVAGGSMILQWSYLGMGLKAAGIFAILLAAVLKPGRLSGRWSLFAGLGGLAGTLWGALFFTRADPLFPGLAVSGAITLFGIVKRSS